MKNTFRPRILLDDELVRLGNPNGDGGYIVSKSGVMNSDVLYSYGIANEVSFELDWCKMSGKPAHLYDHTIDFNCELMPGMTYHKEGISGKPENNTDNAIAHIIKNGDQDKRIYIKCDVEGCEYDWLMNTTIEQLKNVHAITIEFHNSTQPVFKEVVTKLQEAYTIVWAHANYYGGTSNGTPNVIELTFLRTEGHKFGALIDKIPGPLDKPNGGNHDITVTW